MPYPEHTKVDSMLQILFGPIASGKTTYAQKKATEGALIANSDAVVNAVHADMYKLYEKDLKPLYIGIRNQIVAYGAALGRTVVVDSTGLTRERRAGLYNLARELGMDVGLIIFRSGVFAGEEDGLRRYNADPRGYTLQEWIDVGVHHRDVHDPLNPAEEALFDMVFRVPWEENYAT